MPKSLSTYVCYSNQLPNEAKTPVSNAINTWNSASPTSLNFILMGTLNHIYFDQTSPSDSFNSIGTPLPYSQIILYGNSTAVIACNYMRASVKSSTVAVIDEFDILYCMSYTYGVNDATSTPYDWQGLFTHELGHSLGLDEVYSWPYHPSSLPTMYAYAEHTYGSTTWLSVYPFCRDLSLDDKSGKSAALVQSGLQ